MTTVCKQRYEQDCFLACITMATGKDYDELWLGNLPPNPAARSRVRFVDRMMSANGIFGHDVDDAFNRAGLAINRDYRFIFVPLDSISVVVSMLRGCRAILQVPSLNYERQSHIVYWDGETLHDPSNKQQYKWIDGLLIQNVWVFTHPASQQQDDFDKEMPR